MKSLAPVVVAMLMSAIAAPAFADDGAVHREFYSNKDRAAPSALGLAPITGRYPTVGYSLDGLNIPPGALAPIPANFLELPRPYGFGETALPPRRQEVDAKGRATSDAKGRAAWDGASPRMRHQ